MTLEHDGEPCVIDATGPAYDAARAASGPRGTASSPVDIGVGGSIPFIATFQEMFPKAAILVTGVEDPDARAHGPNESLHLGEFAAGLPGRGAALAQRGGGRPGLGRVTLRSLD